MTGLHIIWFRQDLRVHDNAALRAACQSAERDGGDVMALYILPTTLDPERADASADFRAMFDALRDLQAALAQRGAVLHLRQGDANAVFSEIHRSHQIISLHVHEGWAETDQMQGIEAWSLRAGVAFRQYQQFNPPQSPGDTELWQTAWERFMARPRHEAPDMIETANIGIGQWPQAPAAPSDIDADQAVARGGRKRAIQTLRTCLGAGAHGSQITLSSTEAISALKPYLQLGAVSMREVWQAAVGAHQQALKAGLDIRAASIASFLQLLPALFRPRSDPNRANTRSRRALRGAEQDPAGQQLSLEFGKPGS